MRHPGKEGPRHLCNKPVYNADEIIWLNPCNSIGNGTKQEKR